MSVRNSSAITVLGTFLAPGGGGSCRTPPRSVPWQLVEGTNCIEITLPLDQSTATAGDHPPRSSSRTEIHWSVLDADGTVTDLELSTDELALPETRQPIRRDELTTLHARQLRDTLASRYRDAFKVYSLPSKGRLILNMTDPAVRILSVRGRTVLQ